uniref:Ig-like domain-containing protein n=1 Tax=Sinocyclocheilus anshuiensis TaxID=1608454 RepID=A0A671P9C9_9TELE
YILYIYIYIIIIICTMAGTVYQFPPSVKVRSGERVTMHCQLNEVQSFCHTVAWVRVHPVSGIIDILQDSNIPRQTEDQVEYTVCHASIYNATVQDSGTYYCIATDLPKVSELPPNMRVLKVCVDKKARVFHRIMCQSLLFFLIKLEFIFLLAADTTVMPSIDIMTFASKENSVKTQNYVAVSAEEWRTGGACTCVVKFGGLMFNKTLHHYGK